MEFIARMSHDCRSTRDSTDKAGCFLCEAVAAGPERDREGLVLHRGARAFVIMNRYPYNNGHLMIAPCRHEGRLGEMTPDELAEIMALAQVAERVVREEMKADGFNMGLNLGHCAGAGLAEHLHLHAVPRWAGDTNFMPALADTRVIPQSLTELYDLLRPRFDEALGEGGGK